LIEEKAMKRILIFCLAVVLFSSLAQGKFLLEAKGSYFLPSDKNFKIVYAGKFEEWICYGGEIGITLGKGVGIWAGGHYFNKKGKLTLTEEETKIQITPVYGGIKFRLSQSGVVPYLGVGVGYFQYKEESRIGKISKADIGYIGQAGLLFKLGVIVIDFQASYSYCKVKPVDVEADLGGFQAGIGLGFEF
jgi:hypothetical protein